MQKQNNFFYFLLFCSMAMFAACARLPQDNNAPIASKNGPWHPRHWGIQLQNYQGAFGLKRIEQAAVDLWVMDYAIGPQQEFTAEQIRRLKKSGKKIIAYMSIGEVETYRFYAPFVNAQIKGPVNPNWLNNHTAAFWKKEWQNFFLQDGSYYYGPSYLTRLMRAGFDGVFLDVVDAFERFPDRQEKAEAMANFIIAISRRAKELNPHFLVIMQNGLQIRRAIADPSPLLAAIDGVNAESLDFSWPTKSSRPMINQEQFEDILFYQKGGKFVLSLEYFSSKQKARQYGYFSWAKEHHLIPLIAHKNLNGPLLFPAN